MLIKLPLNEPEIKIIDRISDHLKIFQEQKQTGKLTFEINISQGGIGKSKVNIEKELK